MWGFVAVCSPPYDATTSDLFEIAIGSDCSIYPCDGAWCSCRNVFGGGCGSFKGSLYLSIDVLYLQDAAGWLDFIGLSNVSTINGSLILNLNSLSWDGSPGSTINWYINIFPNLQVISRGVSVSVTYGPPLLLLPGPGLTKLRAAARIELSDYYAVIQNNDLAFLSSLQCIGGIGSSGFQLPLVSLQGLENVVDGNTTWPCFTYFSDSTFSGGPTLSDVSALTAYARCGANQRSDNSPAQPCLTVTCGYLDTWTSFCNYVARGTCS